MTNKIVVWLALMLMALALVACQPTGGETGVTPPATEAATTVPATAEPTEAPTEAATDTLQGFIEQLQLAIAARDFTALQGLMSDPFSVGYWLSEGVSYTPEEAAAFLESTLLPEGAQIVWADPDLDLAPMLQGMSPASFLSPDKQVAAALLSAGWGEDASGEAIQFITTQPDGSYRWELLLFSSFGFGGMPTTVEAVLINADEATFYSGPGTTYEAVATVFGGLTYPVIGASMDNNWWRLRCYDDANELILSCWVSADPAVSTPTTP